MGYLNNQPNIFCELKNYGGISFFDTIWRYSNFDRINHNAPYLPTNHLPPAEQPITGANIPSPLPGAIPTTASHGGNAKHYWCSVQFGE